MKMNNSERLAAAIVSPLLAFVGFVAPCIGANADYCTVTNMCWNGAKTNILAIAESRLAANTNDIVGIVLKLEYDLSFSYLDDFTNNGNWGQTPFLLSSPLDAHFMCMRV